MCNMSINIYRMDIPCKKNKQTNTKHILCSVYGGYKARPGLVTSYYLLDFWKIVKFFRPYIAATYFFLSWLERNVYDFWIFNCHRVHQQPNNREWNKPPPIDRSMEIYGGIRYVTITHSRSLILSTHVQFTGVAWDV